MAANVATALRDVRPVGILLEPKKDAGGALVGAFRQHDFIAVTERGTNGRRRVRHGWGHGITVGNGVRKAAARAMKTTVQAKPIRRKTFTTRNIGLNMTNAAANPTAQ